jgi:hypothetical protein
MLHLGSHTLSYFLLKIELCLLKLLLLLFLSLSLGYVGLFGEHHLIVVVERTVNLATATRLGFDDLGRKGDAIEGAHAGQKPT